MPKKTPEAALKKVAFDEQTMIIAPVPKFEVPLFVAAMFPVTARAGPPPERHTAAPMLPAKTGEHTRFNI